MGKKILLISVYGMEMVECGGTLALNAQKGGESYVSFMFGGGAMKDSDIRPIGKQCLEDAAKILGVKKYFFNNFERGRIDVTYEQKVTLCRVIREVKPEIIITQDPEHCQHDLDPDRRQAMVLILEAIALASRDFALEQTPGLAPHPIAKIYYMTPENPNCTVNVADTWHLKEEAFAALHEQMDFVGKHFERGLGVKQLQALVPNYQELKTYSEKGTAVYCAIQKAEAMYYGVGGHGNFALAEQFRFEGRFELEQLI